jgi:hypothetical protein
MTLLCRPYLHKIIKIEKITKTFLKNSQKFTLENWVEHSRVQMKQYHWRQQCYHHQ